MDWDLKMPLAWDSPTWTTPTTRRRLALLLPPADPSASASSCGTPPAWSPSSTPGHCRASRRWSRRSPAHSGASSWASRSPRFLTSASPRPAPTAPSRCSPAGLRVQTQSSSRMNCFQRL